MPYVVSHSVALDDAAYSAGMVVPDAIGEKILVEHSNGATRVAHDDDLCGSMSDACEHDSHAWNATASAAKPASIFTSRSVPDFVAEA